MTAASPIDTDTWLQHAWRNRMQSLLLLGVMAGFLALLGWLLWGRDGLFVLVSVGVVAVLANPAFSPWLVIRMYGARPLDHAETPVLWRAMSELTARAGLSSRPELFYVPSRMLNAFAVGTREQSAIAVTDGLLRQLNLDELIGVLAHEVSHIRNNDLWVMGLADLFSRATSFLSLFGQLLLLLNLPLILFSQVTISWWAILLLIFAPNLSALAQLALSRTREYDADLNAARLTGNPDGLARALAKIERVQGSWLERLFLPGRRVPEPSLLRTHPETEERIARLMTLKPELKGAAQPWLRSDEASDIDALLRARVRRVPHWHMNGLWY
ncbi:MAG: zinc metalloprotease HtpX [Candidatus Sedimenticola endophacoides]